MSNSFHMTDRPLTDFHTYYRKKIRPYLLDLEYKRERFLTTARIHERNYLIAALLIGIVLASITAAMELFGAWSWAFSLLLLAIPVLVMKYWIAPVIQRQQENDEKHEAFYNRYKSKVVESIVRFFDPSLRLEYASQISKDTVRQSQLMQDLSAIDLDGDDFVSGFINKIPVSFSELKLFQAEGRKSTDIFHGVFFSAVLKQKFDGALFIIPKALLNTTSLQSSFQSDQLYTEQPLQSYHRAHNIRVMQAAMREFYPWSIANSSLPLRGLKIDNADATVNYVAFSTEPQMMEHILSKGFWELLFPQTESKANLTDLLTEHSHKVEFQQQVSKGYCLSLIGDELYIMQPQGGDLFEPNMEQTFLDEEGFTNYHDHLRQAFDMIQYLNTEIASSVEG